MLEVLNRSLSTPTIEKPDKPANRHLPTAKPSITPARRPRWPQSAVAVAAALGVLALIGVTSSAIQWLGDDDSDVAQYQSQIEQITEQRDDLVVANADLAIAVDRLEADVAQRVADLDAATAELDQASARLANMRDQSATISAALVTTAARVDALTARVGELRAANESLTAERDGLAAMFPMIVDTSLVGVDVTGGYSAKWSAAYNSGLADIALPKVGNVAITQSAEGWLNVTIPGVVEAGLMRTDGALFTMVDTTGAAPPVDGVARPARVAITIYPGEIVTASDGSTTVTELGLSIVISTPEFGTSPAGVALYGATLTPQS